MKRILIIAILFVSCGRQRPCMSTNDLMVVYKNSYLKGYINGFKKNDFDSAFAIDTAEVYNNFYHILQ